MHAVYGLGYGGSSTNWRALVSGLRSEVLAFPINCFSNVEYFDPNSRVIFAG
jgi:hypothetical protein